MAVAYRNKFAAKCEVTGKMMEKETGWVVPMPRGGWRAICDEVVEKEGHRKFVGNGSPFGGGRRGFGTKHRGVTSGLSVSDAWAKVFQDNEERVRQGERPLTDEQISQHMQQEFPDSPPESRDVRRVRMWRSNYNRGVHSFAEKGAPEEQSREYDAKGQPVEGTTRVVHGGVSEERCRQIAREESGQACDRLAEKMKDRPVVHVHFSAKKVGKVDSRGKHAQFAHVLKLVEARVPILAVGPAGCGKTFLMQQVAESLELPFTFNSMSEGASESHLLGRMLPDEKGTWRYQASPFVESYQKGGVHLLDEVDAADPNLLIAVNAAIANGYLSLPFAGTKPIKRHEDSIIVAAANTFGNGADRQYVGRNQLDAATVDRFKMGTVEMDYDRDVEKALAEKLLEDVGGTEVARPLLQWAWSTREAIATAKLRRIVSTRNIIDASKMLAVGIGFGEVKRAYFAGWSEDEKVRLGQR